MSASAVRTARSGRWIRMMPACVSVASDCAVLVTCFRGSIAGNISLSGEAQSRRFLPRLDQPPDVPRAAWVEEDVPLADRRLLGEEACAEKRLADIGGELAVVAREPAREVGEVRVVAAPLAHAVEPLEDPPRDAAGGIGVLVRARGLAAPAEQPEHRLVVLLHRGRVRRAAPEPRDSLGDPQRMGLADRRAPLAGVAEHEGGERESPRAQAVDAARVVLEGERPEVFEHARLETRRGIAEQRHSAHPLARGHGEVIRRGRHPGVGQVDHRADRRGDEQPCALTNRLGVGVEAPEHGHGGEQALTVGGERDRDRPLARPRALALELGAAVAERILEQVAQARLRRRRGGNAAGGVQRLGERPGHDESAASNAARAASPCTAKTMRSSREPRSRCARTSSTSIRAPSSSGKPPTPVPKATSARLRAPSSSARASVAAVARRMTSAEVGPPRRIVAAWMTQREGMAPAVVSTASPRPIGALRSDSRWTSGPPAREIAPATPPPCASSVLAAFATASTSRVVMSAWSTSTLAIGLPYPHGEDPQAGHGARAGAGRLLPRLDAPGGRTARC